MQYNLFRFYLSDNVNDPRDCLEEGVCSGVCKIPLECVCSFDVCVTCSESLFLDEVIASAGLEPRLRS